MRQLYHSEGDPPIPAILVPRSSQLHHTRLRHVLEDRLPGKVQPRPAAVQHVAVGRGDDDFPRRPSFGRTRRAGQHGVGIGHQLDPPGPAAPGASSSMIRFSRPLLETGRSRSQTASATPKAAASVRPSSSKAGRVSATLR